MTTMKFDKSLPIRRNLPLRLLTFILSVKASHSKFLLPRCELSEALQDREQGGPQKSAITACWDKMKLWRRETVLNPSLPAPDQNWNLGGPIFLLPQYLFACHHTQVYLLPYL